MKTKRPDMFRSAVDNASAGAGVSFLSILRVTLLLVLDNQPAHLPVGIQRRKVDCPVGGSASRLEGDGAFGADSSSWLEK